MEPAPFPFVAQAHMLDGHQRYVADLVALAHTHTQKGYQSCQDAAAKNQRTLDALARSFHPQRLAHPALGRSGVPGALRYLHGLSFYRPRLSEGCR